MVLIGQVGQKRWLFRPLITISIKKGGPENHKSGHFTFSGSRPRDAISAGFIVPGTNRHWSGDVMVCNCSIQFATNVSNREEEFEI